MAQLKDLQPGQKFRFLSDPVGVTYELEKYENGFLCKEVSNERPWTFYNKSVEVVICGEVTEDFKREFIKAFEEHERGTVSREGYDSYPAYVAAESNRLRNYQHRVDRMCARHGVTYSQVIDYLNK